MGKMAILSFFCSSAASTALCSDQISTVSGAHRTLDGRHVSRHDHQLRRQQQPHISHNSQPPMIVPKLPNNYSMYDEKSRKSTSFSSDAKNGTCSDARRKSSADVYDLTRIMSHRSRPDDSSKYLLSDNLKMAPILVRHQSAKEPRNLMMSANRDCPKLVKSCSSSCSRRDQVVVLKVSLHCKGCEEKVRKHISKMEGVTSFNIDFEKKKVTVIGNVTPVSVVASVSKVKKAQLWPSPYPTPTPAPAPTPASSSSSTTPLSWSS